MQTLKWISSTTSWFWFHISKVGLQGELDRARMSRHRDDGYC